MWRVDYAIKRNLGSIFIGIWHVGNGGYLGFLNKEYIWSEMFLDTFGSSLEERQMVKIAIRWL